MPRRARELIEGGIYHVYNRVASGEDIFADPETAVGFVEQLREVKERDGWTVFAWCLMSNHYHLVLRASAVPLTRSMHTVHSRFGHWFNRRSRRSGGVWQSRYQAKLVDEERYLGQVILYVHLNPVRAGVEGNLADSRFCGHREIVRRIAKPLTDVDDALLCFGASTRSARRAYSSAVKAGKKAIKGEAEAGLVGFRSLRWSDRELAPKRGQKYVDELGRSTGRERGMLSAERYLAAVCGLLGTDEEALGGRSKDRETAELRRLVAALGVERWRQRCKDLAGALGKSPNVVSYWVVEGVRRRREDPKFAERLEDLDERLAKTT